MSDNIPYEIQVEIFKRLPLKLLIQLRSVSKAWKSLIDSSDFVAHYNGHVQHLLVNTNGALRQDYVLFVDDDTFPQQNVCVPIPGLLNWLSDYWHERFWIIGCSNGLLCLYGNYREGSGSPNSLTSAVILWNLSIRKLVAVILPNVGDKGYETAIGFGVCCETGEPKIVKIRYIYDSNKMDSISCIPWQVEVFTLSTRAWRSPRSNLPRKSFKFVWRHVVVDGFIYWLATDRITMDGGFRSCNLIISFDLTTEEFKDVNLPDSLALESYTDPILKISKLKNSLVVIARDLDANDRAFNVWKVEDDVRKSFTKLYTVIINNPQSYIIGFRKNGSPIVEILEEENDSIQLVVYEPYSKHIDMESDTIYCSFSVFPYIETLLLIDQPHLVVYNDGLKWRAKNKRLLKHTS